ncbi:hypothetical protein [Cellulomonas fimi]|uniref:HTH araC/xylS-type domain-containing protein n=1 Tax=Cellulomonas fimi (strain ATCC 484 / DSM 20113 / JCM 1341 / CCUG 24087 / LMG 16345 / NBRC 15513 / NCIMB 8980 / NCTC 7547 / NRS-133) TaxID=590998 RepID=F4H742_CELFA|nr:hypothetical protein [Cellulomonas fimi]AEE45676.1 hypothetical protein Celf_1542 [Cellulomonas fimi ATCC 484]NNH07407.1 hypothetical protein [Cellulomonas fimi]VEH30258.1 Uncharacterised protein [Cellulomonas fimi]
MTYRRFPAPEPARDVVEHLWVDRQPAGTLTREVLLPDGHGLVLVTIGNRASRVDPLARRRSADVPGVRGPARRPVVREQAGPSARLGAQLRPLALAQLGIAVPADEVVPLDRVLPTADVATCQAALEAGDDARAADVLGAAIAGRLAVAPPDDVLTSLRPVVDEVLATRGLVTASDLARGSELPVPTLHRWCVERLGLAPDQLLAAVRFSAFVRDAVGPGPVRPQDVLGAIRWYVQAGYPPREVERFTGSTPLELRRVEQGIAEALGVPVAG